MSTPQPGLLLDQITVDAIRRLARSLANGQPLEEQLRGALDTAIAATGATGGSVLLHDPERRDLRFVYSVTKREDSALPPLVQDLVAATMSDREGIAGRVFQSGRAEIVSDARADPDFAEHVVERTRIRVENVASAPICLQGVAPVGVIQLVNKKGGFDDNDVHIVSVLSGVAALSVLLHYSREETERTEGA